MRLATILPSRLRSLAPEATAFALIGVGNAVLYLIIFNLVMTIGAVKATVLATGVTTTLAYAAHRHWTYRSRPKRQVRREYTLFVGFNMAGMLIQSSVVAVGKYGFGLNEERDRLWFNLATLAGIAMATTFRFWAYRTLVFRPHPTDHALPTNAVEALAEVFEEQAEFKHLTAPLEAELAEPAQAELPHADPRAAGHPARDVAPARDTPPVIAEQLDRRRAGHGRPGADRPLPVQAAAPARTGRGGTPRS